MKPTVLQGLKLCSLVPFVSVVSWPTVSYAQVQGGLPSRQEVQPPVPSPEAATPRVRVRSDNAIAAAPCPLSQFDLNVSITSIVFTGVDGAALAPEIAALLDGIAAAPPAGLQKLQAVCDIRDSATGALRAKGYVASVLIPPQRLEDGKLRLEVITARIVDVQVRGNVGPYRDTMGARIAKLKALNPVNQRDAERILLLADDVPGLDVQLSLRPAGTKPGEVIGDLTVSYRPARVLLNVQNYNSRQIGRETAFARAEVYGLTGLSDLTFIGAQSTFQTNEQQAIQAGHVMGLGSNGITLGLSGSYAWTRPDVGLLDLRAESYSTRLELGVPLIRSVRFNTTISGGFDFSEQRTKVFGATGGSPLNRDRIRTLYARVDAGIRAPLADGTTKYTINGMLEVRQGIDVFGATKPQSFSNGFTPSRFEGRATATVIRANLNGSFPVGPVITFSGSAQGQWASSPLLNLDEFAIGNLTIGKGYDPGANSADRAIGLHGEVQANITNTPKFRFDIFSFYDSVWIYNLDTAAIENNRRLGSYGIGGRMLLTRRGYLEATYARPEDPALLVPGARRAPERFLLSLTLQFSPRSR